MIDGSFRLSSDGIYRCIAFQQFVWQEHGFGTRNGNPQAEVTLRQVHSSCVVNARDLHNGGAKTGEEGDALISDIAGTRIAVKTADCVPILLIDPKHRAVAAIHAGWRGSAAHIATQALKTMERAFSTDAADVYAAIGPCIRPCCYEVGEEVAAQFSTQFPEWGLEDDAVLRLDLPEANRRQMMTSGVPQDRIFDCGLCTACDAAQFYSFRREPQNPGRMISAIARLA